MSIHTFDLILVIEVGLLALCAVFALIKSL